MARQASRILAAVNDPGGTQALLPVLDALAASRPHRLDLVAAPLAEAIVGKQGIPYHKGPLEISQPQAAELFARYQPRLLLTATSWQSNLEQRLRDQAWHKGIPSIVLLDYWSNYALRWQGAVYPISALPDTVCVPDEAAAREMVAVGFPKEKLVVTGQPFVEAMFRKGLVAGTQSHAGQYLFLSQPSVVDGKTISQAEHLARVVEALTDIAQRSGRAVTLKIKPHPKEEEGGSLRGMAEQLANPHCAIEVADKNQPVDRYLDEAECVIGYYTMALLQARAQGKRTVSLAAYEIGDGLQQAMRAAGVLVTPVDRISLQDILAKDSPPDCRQGYHQGATTNVLAVIDSLLAMIN